MDNPFILETSGQADWDSALSANFQAVDRGFAVTERAGTAISTGQCLDLSSGGFFYPNTGGAAPVAYAYTAAASGDSMTALAWGIVRSLAINSATVCGQRLYANGSGFLTTTTNSFPAGVGLSNGGIMFSPLRFNPSGGYTPTFFNSSLAIAAVANSLHTFTMSLGGLHGWNRRVRVNGSSADLVELKFYGDAAMTAELQYQTISGGISAVTPGLNDRAGWPFDTDSGTIYGTCFVFSHAGGVGSDTIGIQADWEV